MYNISHDYVNNIILFEFIQTFYLIICNCNSSYGDRVFVYLLPKCGTHYLKTVDVKLKKIKTQGNICLIFNIKRLYNINIVFLT